MEKKFPYNDIHPILYLKRLENAISQLFHNLFNLDVDATFFYKKKKEKRTHTIETSLRCKAQNHACVLCSTLPARDPTSYLFG